MDPHVVRVQSPDELLAAVPHLLGFNPEESVVLVAFSPERPVARVDLPRTAEERERRLEAVRAGMCRHTQPGDTMAVICFSEDRRSSELASRHLAAGLERELGVAVPLRLWATDERWVELTTGRAGDRTQEAAIRIAAEAVRAGAPPPAASRTSLAASLVGDRAPVVALLPYAHVIANQSPPLFESAWALERLEQFHADGNRLTDVDATRMLVAIESISCRDAIWDDMSQDNAASHVAMWTDLTRRAPDEVRAPAGSLLAFASWLQGDGARARCALEQVPADRPYSMAGIVASALQNGLSPKVWEGNSTVIRALAGDLDESYVPTRPAHHQDREIAQRLNGPDYQTPSR